MYLDGQSKTGYWGESSAVGIGEIATNRRPQYRFTDFFAGLGGFHAGLSRLGHECVYACEIDDELRGIYEKNFGLLPARDIRAVTAESVPEHDVLCAGFPCQPFSLAGKKKGTACPKSGKLIDDVFRIVEYHHPKYVFLENVPNVLTIADGTFWRHVCRSFVQLSYRVDHRIYSPLQFGLPQQRNRLFIIAARTDMPLFEWPAPTKTVVRPLGDFIRPTANDAKCIEMAKKFAIEKWNEVIQNIPAFTSDTLIAAEFGATYPVEGLSHGRHWRHYKGAFGDSLDDAENRDVATARLPYYAAENGGVVPNWMRSYVATSRAIYASNPAFFDTWKLSMRNLPNSWQKLEWRGDRTTRDIWQNTIQFRASGIRVMRPNMAPSLIAMTPTQVPIIGVKQRYIGVREAAALQSLENLRVFPQNSTNAFKALGNAVNAQIVFEVAKAVLR